MKAVICALILLCALPAWAWREALPDAHLIGAGKYRWFGLSIYSAKLWSVEQPFILAQATDGQWSDQQPFALELTYHRSISRDRFVSASMDEIRRIFGGRYSAEQLAQWQREMEQAFVDVSPDMRITGVYLPAEGVRFYVNDKLQHRVADPIFAQAFFAIWLNERTRDTGLRQRLLASPSS